MSSMVNPVHSEVALLTLTNAQQTLGLDWKFFWNTFDVTSIRLDTVKFPWHPCFNRHVAEFATHPTTSV